MPKLIGFCAKSAGRGASAGGGVTFTHVSPPWWGLWEPLPVGCGDWRACPPRLSYSPLGPPTQTAAMGVDDGLFTLHHWVISGTFLARYTRRFIRQTGYCLVELTKTRDTYGSTGTITAGFCVLERMIRHQPGGGGWAKYFIVRQWETMHPLWHHGILLKTSRIEKENDSDVYTCAGI